MLCSSNLFSVHMIQNMYILSNNSCGINLESVSVILLLWSWDKQSHKSSLPYHCLLVVFKGLLQSGLIGGGMTLSTSLIGCGALTLTGGLFDTEGPAAGDHSLCWCYLCVKNQEYHHKYNKQPLHHVIKSLLLHTPFTQRKIREGKERKKLKKKNRPMNEYEHKCVVVFL